MHTRKALFPADNRHDLGGTAGGDSHAGNGDADSPHNGTALAAELLCNSEEGGVKGIVIPSFRGGESRDGRLEDRLGERKGDLVFLILMSGLL